jgi:hypothetical protein
VDGDRGPAEGPRRHDTHLGVLVGEHEPGGADPQLGVAEAAVVADDPELLDGAERGDVPVDRSVTVVDGEVGRGGQVGADGGWFGGGHGLLLGRSTVHTRSSPRNRGSGRRTLSP